MPLKNILQSSKALTNGTAKPMVWPWRRIDWGGAYITNYTVAASSTSITEVAMQIITELARLLPNEQQKTTIGHMSISVCMCVQMHCTDRLLRFSIEIIGVITGRWFVVLKEDKHDLVEKPLPGAVITCVARCTAHPATNALGVWCLE